MLIMVDTNECASPGDNNCDTNAACTNTPGGFICTCNQGYTGDGVTCVGKQYNGNCNGIFVVVVRIFFSSSRFY